MEEKKNRLFIGSEYTNTGGNHWALELDEANLRCRWGYHTRWMGNYDKTVRTDGTLDGRIIQVDGTRFQLAFETCYLHQQENDELRKNTFCVHDEQRRKDAIAKAKNLWKYMEVSFTLDVAREGLFHDEVHPEGLFPEKDHFVEIMGEFLVRAGGKFTAILTNQDILVERERFVGNEGTEDEFEHFGFVFRYPKGQYAQPFGFHRKHIPLFETSTKLDFLHFEEAHREAYRQKATYHSMSLTNRALELLEREPRFSQEELEQARSAST